MVIWDNFFGGAVELEYTPDFETGARPEIVGSNPTAAISLKPSLLVCSPTMADQQTCTPNYARICAN
jgi:hypothetical protein